MNKKSHGTKGFKTEELLRQYFLRAGFFVVRGVALQFDGSELTDIDLWVYERSATLARRRTIIDVKDKQRPQAAERLFFVSGLGKTIGVEGVGVATTDKNPRLRELARKNKVLWIDGEDLQRLKGSETLSKTNRLSDEEFLAIVDALDKQRGGRVYRDHFGGVKSAVGDRFGASSANHALDVFQILCAEVIKSHPGSDAAKMLTRLCYYAGALVAAALDFASADSALRPVADRNKHMANVIRFGENVIGTYDKLNWTEMALREYSAQGQSVAQEIRSGFEHDVNQIPAEDLAEVVVRMSNSDSLFNVARDLEHAAYSIGNVAFDSLPTDSKSFVGALLDFAKQDRKRFAEASPKGSWEPVGEHVEEPPAQSDGIEVVEKEEQGKLL